MGITIIGIDCAVDPRRVGLALGTFNGEHTRLLRAEIGALSRDPAEVVADWLSEYGGPVLLALDAPLGWPMALGTNLQAHCAGAVLDCPADTLFRRETDRFVRRIVGKQSLDVGADRIARTAHAALGLLANVRRLTGMELPLAWEPNLVGNHVIEVYPAATLLDRGVAESGYKKADATDARQRLLNALSKYLVISGDSASMLRSADALDAAVCVLAAHDFLLGTGYATP